MSNSDDFQKISTFLQSIPREGTYSITVNDFDDCARVVKRLKSDSGFQNMKNTGNNFTCYTESTYVRLLKLLLYCGITNTTPAIAPPRKSFDSEIDVECLDDMKKIIRQMKKEYHNIDILGHYKLRCNDAAAFDWLTSFVVQQNLDTSITDRHYFLDITGVSRSIFDVNKELSAQKCTEIEDGTMYLVLKSKKLYDAA